MDYAVYYRSPDDTEKITHTDLPIELKTMYLDSGYLYKVIYEVHIGQGESIQKNITVVSEKEMDIDELCEKVTGIFVREVELNDYPVYQLIGVHVIKVDCQQ